MSDNRIAPYLERDMRDIIKRAFEATREYEAVKISPNGAAVILQTYDGYEIRINISIRQYEITKADLDAEYEYDQKKELE